MNDAINRTASHAGIYALGTLLRNAVSIIMLPIYTTYLSPEDYGVVEMMSMLLDVVGILLCNRLGEAVFRYYYESDSQQDQNKVVSSSFVLQITLNGLGCFVLMVFAEPISQLIFGDIGYASILRMFSLALLLEAFTLVPLMYIRIQQRAWLFLSVNIIKLVLQVSLNLYFVVYKDLHVWGVIYSALIVEVILGVGLTAYTAYHAGLRPSLDKIKLLFGFSIPIIFSTLGAFYITFGDRYFLRHFSDLAEVGIYSLGYKFGFILMQFTWEPFSKVWDTQRYEIHKEGNTSNQYATTFMYCNLVIILVGVGMAFFVKDALKVISAESFWRAHEVVPPILLAYLFWAWTHYCNLGILIKKRTSLFAYVEVLAVIAITLAYYFLIPVYGAVGAAWATVVGLFTRFVFIYYVSRRCYDMKLMWFRVWALLAYSVIFFVLVNSVAPEEFWNSLIVRAAIYLVFLSGIWFLPLLDTNVKRGLLEMAENITSSLRQRFSV